jgi:hypothetical protein
MTNRLSKILAVVVNNNLKKFSILDIVFFVFLAKILIKKLRLILESVVKIFS